MAEPTPKPTIGWREWVQVPGLSAELIKAKIDTGARTSSLYAENIKVHNDTASFELFPDQHSTDNAIHVTCPVTDHKDVRTSDGQTENRPVITTIVHIADYHFEIDVTLTSSDDMGFRLVLGRTAIRRHFMVDPSRSFLLTPRTPE